MHTLDYALSLRYSLISMATSVAEALTCFACYQYLGLAMGDPQILTCGHTFCKRCLEHIYRTEFGRQLPCPVCRQVTPVPEGDTSKLPTNITVKSLAEGLKTQRDLEQKAEIKIKKLIEHADNVNQQKQKVKEAISACRGEVHKAHDEAVMAVAKLAERKNALLREFDNHESALLDKLDELVQKDIELVSRVSNARGLMGMHDTLNDLLKTDDCNLSEAISITRRAKMLHFSRKLVDVDLGEVMMWKEKICVELSKNTIASALTADGRMAVGYHEGGIDIFSADGELQQTVLKTIKISRVVFLSDGRCVVRDTSYGMSLYTPEWEKLDVRFDGLEGGGGLAVDCDDLIYVDYWITNKIRVFTPSGGKAIREISCGGYKPHQISVMEPSKMLVVRTQVGDIRILDQQGKEVHSIAKESDTNALYATVCKDGTILIAAMKHGRDRVSCHVSVKQYTSELTYVKTIITDNAAETVWWCNLREFPSGELVLCSENRLHIFHKTVSHPVE